jgi:hypothetical protein
MSRQNFNPNEKEKRERVTIRVAIEKEQKQRSGDVLGDPTNKGRVKTKFFQEYEGWDGEFFYFVKGFSHIKCNAY